MPILFTLPPTTERRVSSSWVSGLVLSAQLLLPPFAMFRRKVSWLSCPSEPPSELSCHLLNQPNCEWTWFRQPRRPY